MPAVSHTVNAWNFFILAGCVYKKFCIRNLLFSKKNYDMVSSIYRQNQSIHMNQKAKHYKHWQSIWCLKRGVIQKLNLGNHKESLQIWHQIC